MDYKPLYAEVLRLSAFVCKVLIIGLPFMYAVACEHHLNFELGPIGRALPDCKYLESHGATYKNVSAMASL